MFERASTRVGLGALATAAALIVALAAPAGGGAAVPGCGAFAAQADAQDAFVAANGSPARNVGRMDPDRDGVACEGLPAPYKGYATIGYNRKKGFFYGIVTMPPPQAGGEAPCLYGNRSYPDAPRRLNIYKVGGRRDKPLLGEYKASALADPAAGKLVWKVPRASVVSGRYYVAFDERVRLSPYGRNECPGFSSRPTLLPRPRNR